MPQSDGADIPDAQRLVDGQLDVVYRYALRLTGSSQDAEDLTQETLLRAWRRRRQLRAAGSVRLWVLQIATNLFRDGLRRRRPQASSDEAPICRRAPAEDRASQREDVARAMAALDALPWRQRQVMHLVVVEQLTNNEAAQVMGVSPEAAKSSLSAARTTIRRRLADIDAELSPQASARATSEVRNKE